MLADGRKAHRRTLVRGALLLLVTLLLAVSLLPAARGDVPTQVTNPDASRTVTWTVNTPSGLTADNVSFEGGHGTLRWEYQNLTWIDAIQAAKNGSLSPSMAVNASGLGLPANWTNWMQNPAFGSNASWAYVNGSARNVIAQWNESMSVGEIGSTWSGDQKLWESMDHVVPTWTGTGGPGASATVAQNGTSNPAPKQGQGTMGIGALLPGDAWIGAVNSSLNNLDWSANDTATI